MQPLIYNKKQNGFTLIELLVVIAIIGILASIVIASLSSSRTKARDAKRRTELRELKTAMELYYAKCGTYTVRKNCKQGIYGLITGIPPNPPGSGAITISTYPGSQGSISQGLVDNGVLSSNIEKDSKLILSPWLILFKEDKYVLRAKLENPSSEDIAQSSKYKNQGCPPGGLFNYCIGN